MDLEFKDLEYDLGRNFILKGENLLTLQHLSMLKIFEYCFKSKLVIDKVLDQSLENKSLLTAKDNWCHIESFVSEMILTSNVPTKLYKEFRQVIHFVSNEIFEFLLKLPNGKMNIFFLKNLVFTSQATVNGVETVLQILDDKDICNDDKLEIALQYFAGEKHVKKYLENVGCSEIENWMENRDNTALYIPLYFWNWIINNDQGSFRMLRKMKDLYSGIRCTCNEQNSNETGHSSSTNFVENDIVVANSCERCSRASDLENTVKDRSFLYGMFSLIYANEDSTSDIDTVSNDDEIDELFEIEMNKICGGDSYNTAESDIQRCFSEDENVICNFIFNWMLDNHNEMAVQYLWNNISCIRDNKIFYLLRLLKEGSDFKIMNMIMFLFTKCVQSLFIVIFSGYVVQATIENLRWNTQFLRYYESLQSYIERKVHFLLLSNIVCKLHDDLIMKRSDSFNMHILKTYLLIIPSSEKRLILNSEKEYFYKILDIVVQTGDMGAFKNLMSGFENEYIFKLLLAKEGVSVFNNAFDLINFDFIDSITEELKLEEEEGVIKLKIDIFMRRAYPLLLDLITGGKYELVNSIYTWSSKISSVNEVIKLKKTFPFEDDRALVKELLFKNLAHLDRFVQLDEFLNWCFSDDQEMVSKFKKEILNVSKSNIFKTNFYLDIRKWVQYTKWDLLEKLFRWSGCTKKELLHLKYKLMSDDIFMHNIFSKERGGVEFLANISSCCQTSRSHRREFDFKILKQNLYFLKLIRNHDFDLIDKIVLWCKPEDDQLVVLKNNLLISSIDYLVFDESKFKEESFDDYVGWFQPSFSTRMKISKMSVSYFKKNKRVAKLIRCIEKFTNSYVV